MVFCLAVLTLAGSPAAAEVSASVRLTQLGYLREGMEDASIAVRNFQIANGVHASGMLDPATLAALESSQALSKTEYLQQLAARYDVEPLRMGMMNEQVRALQQRLIELEYYRGTADGVFGKGTQRAVMTFQIANGLYTSGEADGAVLYRLDQAQAISWPTFLSAMLCSSGDSGAGVRALQCRLRRLGYFEGECTASFGEVTQDAVERFQEENGLEVTGEADEATCALLYGGSPVSLVEDDVLSEGDAGEEVRALQRRLGELGYLDAPYSGQFDHATLVAVTLFEIADGREATGEADEALIQALERDDAVRLQDATQALDESCTQVDDAMHERAVQIASDLLGTAFSESAENPYPGFGFVQYVYARLGVALYDPQSILRDRGMLVESATALEAGEVAALRVSTDAGTRLFFGLCLGDGRAAYVSAQTGFVVSVDLTSVEYESAYVWIFDAA